MLPTSFTSMTITIDRFTPTKKATLSIPTSIEQLSRIFVSLRNLYLCILPTVARFCMVSRTNPSTFTHTWRSHCTFCRKKWKKHQRKQMKRGEKNNKTHSNPNVKTYMKMKETAAELKQEGDNNWTQGRRRDSNYPNVKP